MPSMRFLVHGIVQGVGFRWFVLHEARRLGLRGWVSNRQDGSVEVVAEGSAATLLELENALARGPGAGRVDRVEKSPNPHETGTHKSFDIR